MAGAALPEAGEPRRPRGEDTLGERAAALIERDILSGALAPGLRLGVQSLSATYDIGTTPLREGLSRLVARGIVTAVGQRGFRVADVSRADLDDITRLRVLVETEALSASMERGGDAWEVGIVAALHGLKLCLDRAPEGMAEGSEEFDRCHKRFHRALIAACGSERLLRLHDDLYAQAYRYRRLMMHRLSRVAWENPRDPGPLPFGIEPGRAGQPTRPGLGSPSRFLAVHEALAEAVMARRADAARAGLVRHLRQTLATVYGAGDGA